MINNTTFSQALQGFRLHLEARDLSPHTVRDYFTTFRKFTKFLAADPPLARLTHHDIERFLTAQTGVKKKTRLNYHTGLSALWTWAVAEGLVDEHIVHRVAPPEPEKTVIEPYTKTEVKLMLDACHRSRIYRRHFDHAPVSYTLPLRRRNRAIILLLLDTGLRASELCGLTIGQIDMRHRKFRVEGKGAKQRMIHFSARTGQALWRYWLTRPDRLDHSPAFHALDDHDIPLQRSGLAQLIRRIGDRAGVARAHPHRFRHTFAINFLRNGGNIYVLQQLLGHSTLKMVKIYLKLAEVDSENAHRLASPVANWNL